ACQREHPADLLAVGPLAIPVLGLADVDAGPAQRRGVAGEVVGLQAEVDEAAALLERREPAMVRARLVEADQLDVRAILEGDQAVVGADAGVASAGHDGEAERAIVLGRRLQTRDGDDEMVDTEQHQRPPKAGAISLTKRVNWPR